MSGVQIRITESAFELVGDVERRTWGEKTIRERAQTVVVGSHEPTNTLPKATEASDSDSIPGVGRWTVDRGPL